MRCTHGLVSGSEGTDEILAEPRRAKSSKEQYNTTQYNTISNTTLTAMLRAHTLVFTDKLVSEIEPLAVAAMGSVQFLQTKESIAMKVTRKIPDVIDSSYEYAEKAMDMETAIREKMTELPPQDFEGVLHPALRRTKFSSSFWVGFWEL